MATITITPTTTYQTIIGWEATGQAAEDYMLSTDWDIIKPILMDKAVNELGINRIRMEAHSMQENPYDYYADFLVSGDENDFINNISENINDNADPNVINPSGFQWTFTNRVVNEIILPMRTLLEERGERLYVNVCMVDFSGGRASADFLFGEHPDEYAEFMLALFQHMDYTFGFVPDAIEIILEPDFMSEWSGTAIGNTIVATGDRLSANGYYPDFIAPSNTNIGTAITYFDDAIAVSGVSNYITDFSYHRYSGESD